MTEKSTSSSNDEMMRMMFQQMMQNNQRKEGPGFIAGFMVAVSALAIGAGGATAFFMLKDDGKTQTTTAVAAPTATISGLAPTALQDTTSSMPVAAVPMQPNRVTVPSPTLGGSGNARIAQSSDGQIYAFEPNSGLAFRFVAGAAGPEQLTVSDLPDDIRERLTQGSQAGAGGAVDPAALAAQANRAQAALAAQATTDRRRPPINKLLQRDSEVVSQIIAGLKRAQGMVRPADGQGMDSVPTVYAFFDPRCPHCHSAYQGLDGKFTIKWLPVSVFGRDGEENHAFLFGAAELSEQEVDGQSLPAASLTEDPGALSSRLAEFMAEDQGRFQVPAGTELTDAHEFILGENAELFRLLSRGAEELRAVPSFFIAGEDGRAVWLQGYDADTDNKLITDIIAGNAS